MKKSSLHGPRRAQHWISPIWFWPALSSAAMLVVGTVAIRTQLPKSWAALAWPGDADSASSMVETVASTVVTVTTVTFTLTVVALQLASQQFSPRLLREFSRDPVVKTVLSVLVATFVLAVTVMRGLGGQDAVPALAALLVFIAGLASLGAVLQFINHLVRLLRVDTMMLTVHDETSHAIKLFYPPYEEGGADDPDPPSFGTTPGHVVTADRSGFLRTVTVDKLVGPAQQHDVIVHVLARPGDHLVVGTPVAEVWKASGSGGDASVDEEVRTALSIGYERTLEQDAAFGFRQLEDIAVRALSPGINDPVTAVHAVGHMGDLLVRLTGCRLGSTVHRDREGVPRAVVPDRDLAYYVDLVCGPVRRYGRHEPTVLVGLLRMLRDVAVSTRDDEQRKVVVGAADLVVDAVDDDLLPEEKETVADLRRRVSLALDGDLSGAYTDHAGETRSL